MNVDNYGPWSVNPFKTKAPRYVNISGYSAGIGVSRNLFYPIGIYLFKVKSTNIKTMCDNKDIRTTLITSSWCLYC